MIVLTDEALLEREWTGADRDSGDPGGATRADAGAVVARAAPALARCNSGGGGREAAGQQKRKERVHQRCVGHECGF